MASHNTSFVGTWSATASQKTVFKNDYSDDELIVGIRYDLKDKKEYYLLLCRNGKRSYVSTLYTDYIKTRKGYNFEYDGTRYLWCKVATGQVKISQL
jgi:hypothetical protein